VFREDERRVRAGNAVLNLNILREMAMEKKRVSAKRRMTLRSSMGISCIRLCLQSKRRCSEKMRITLDLFFNNVYIYKIDAG
jgi:hypothetical protein